MTTLTETELAELERLESEATAEPWVAWYESAESGDIMARVIDDDPEYEPIIDNVLFGIRSGENWSLIMQLRNAAKRLIAQARRVPELERELDFIKNDKFDPEWIDGRIEVYQPNGKAYFCYRIQGADCGPFKTWREAYHHAEYTLAFRENVELCQQLERVTASHRSGA